MKRELDFMLGVERILHKRGWDEPPVLASVKRMGSRLSLVELKLPWGKAEPGHLVYDAGKQMIEPTEWGDLSARTMALLPGFYGVMFAYEGWLSDKTFEERGGIKAADYPGSREMRGVSIVTVRGGVFQVARVRGEKAEAFEQTDHLHGRAQEGLIDMVKAVAAHMPDRVVDRAALDKLHVLTDEEVAVKVREARAAREVQERQACVEPERRHA